MSVQVVQHAYGKSRIRLVFLDRHSSTHHSIKELTIEILLEGDFSESFERADNSKVVPTDTMKNTVYVLAHKEGVHSVEQFGIVLVRHFLEKYPQVQKVRVALIQHPWIRIPVNGKPHPHSFYRGSELRTANVIATRNGIELRAGIDGLLVLKSTGSSFYGFNRCSLTTLKDAHDRFFSTTVVADWKYTFNPNTAIDSKLFDANWEQFKQILTTVFAETFSYSVQDTVYKVAKKVLEDMPLVEEVHMRLPNSHIFDVDLSRFGSLEPGKVYVPSPEPHGTIEATVKRISARL